MLEKFIETVRTYMLTPQLVKYKFTILLRFSLFFFVFFFISNYISISVLI